jgi:Guanylyl cyclase.
MKNPCKPFNGSPLDHSCIKFLFSFCFFGALDHDGLVEEEQQQAQDDNYGDDADDENRNLYYYLSQFCKEESCTPVQINRGTSLTYGPSGRRVTNIIHCQQQDIWDCGITCIQMILRWLRYCSADDRVGVGSSCHDICESTVPLSSNEMEDRYRIQSAIGTDSIWSIDLVMLLDGIVRQSIELFPRIDFQSVMVSYLFTSRKLGVDDSHKSLSYYKKSFRWDEYRVKKHFNIAQERHLPMTQVRNLDMNIVVDLVSREDVVAIALIDNNVIRRYEEEPELDWDGNYVYDSKYMTFSGHYVLICGISSELRDINRAKGNRLSKGNDGKQKICMVIKNPGSTEPFELLTLDLFESAWKSKGTDDDIIFIRAVGKQM